MNAYAKIAAPLLPTAIFICMRRNPLYLAQALLKGRRDIHGSDKIAYGLDDPAWKGVKDRTPYEAVCDQVQFHQQLERQQLEAIGSGRYWILDYESFCNHPNSLVARVTRYIAPSLRSYTERLIQPNLKPFKVSLKQVLDDEEFALLTEALEKRNLLEASQKRTGDKEDATGLHPMSETENWFMRENRGFDRGRGAG